MPRLPAAGFFQIFDLQILFPVFLCLLIVSAYSIESFFFSFLQNIILLLYNTIIIIPLFGLSGHLPHFIQENEYDEP